MLILASLIIFLLVFAYVGVPIIYERCARLLLKRKAIESKSLVLTFDDGPGSRLTPAILELLAENNAKATFFLLGTNIVGREGIVREIAGKGHEICSHGYDHLNHWKVSPFRALADIKKGWQAIDTALGSNRGIYPFRPPNGKLNLISFLYLRFHRVPIFYWSLDTKDTWAAHKRDCKPIDVVIKETGGAVTLAHDFDRKNDSINNMVLDVLHSALSVARETGMRTLKISEFVGSIGKT